jgi:hypothetical protein
MNTSITRTIVVAASLHLVAMTGAAAETRGNLLKNSSFENGVQFWKGDGKVVTLQPQNLKVYEIEASKSRLKEVSQEFELNELKQVQIVFRARSVNYKGAGLRISVHVKGGGSLLWTRQLPEDGSWADIKLDYLTTNAKEDRRELIIAAHLGTGEVQIDDVEVREPTTIAPAATTATTPATKPPPTPAAVPAPPATGPVPTPAAAQNQIGAAGSFPDNQAAAAKELMGFRWDWLASGGNYKGKSLFEPNGDALDANNNTVNGDWRINADGSLTYRRGNGNGLVWVLKRVSADRFEGAGTVGAALGRTCSLTRGVARDAVK